MTLRSTYSTLLTFSSSNVSNLLSVIQPAVAPVAPISPRPLLNALLAAVLGFLLVASLAAISAYLDDTIKDTDELQEVAGLSALGTIARLRGDPTRSEIYRLAALLYPRSGVAEAYRTLRTNLEFASVDAPIQTLLVTSSTPGEGKTITASNLAVVFAQSGRASPPRGCGSTASDFHRVFDLPNTHGLTTMLRSDVSVDAIAQTTEQENLRVITQTACDRTLPSCSARSACERYSSGSIGRRPPHSLQSAASGGHRCGNPGSLMERTLLVIDAVRSRRRAVRPACEALARASATVVGAVLNRVSDRAQRELLRVLR